jgi:hypothetical protein
MKTKYNYTNIKLRCDDVNEMISTYEFLLWNNTGEEKKHCKRILTQLKNKFL